MAVRIFLILMAMSYAAFGTISLVDPVAMAAGLGVEIGGPNGAYELRGVYGGISLGAALLCLSGALRAGMRRPALWFITTYMGGYLLARAGALLMGPPPTPVYVGYIAFEAVTLFAALAGLRAGDPPAR